MAPGEVAEWSNAPHSKCGIGASLSGVRIPPSPPLKSSKALTRFNYWGERSVRSPNQSPSLLRFRPGDHRISRLINRVGQSPRMIANNSRSGTTLRWPAGSSGVWVQPSCVNSLPLTRKIVGPNSKFSLPPREARANSLNFYRRRCGLCFGGSVPVIARYHAASDCTRALAAARSDCAR